MLSGNLRVSLIAAILIYFAVILKLLKDKSLALKYTLLWIFSGLLMAVLVIFPQLLTHILGLLGIQTYMNGLFLFFIGFIIMIVMSITSIVSKQNAKIRTLIQENGILEKRIRDIEAQINTDKG